MSFGDVSITNTFDVYSTGTSINAGLSTEPDKVLVGKEEGIIESLRNHLVEIYRQLPKAFEVAHAARRGTQRRAARTHRAPPRQPSQTLDRQEAAGRRRMAPTKPPS